MRVSVPTPQKQLDSGQAIRKIIIAEDDDSARALLSRQLERAGYGVIACANGAAALEVLKKQDCGIVLADWNMPVMSGLELCEAARELCALRVLNVVYFILLTANADKESIVRGLEAGADDYLTKPYNFRELVARIRVGQRLLDLQDQLVKRQVELHSANAQLATLNNRLERLANTDGLTGLLNRRHFLERASDFWNLASRSGKPLVCIMFDLDRFKSVNDTYGHAAGDELLTAVATLLRKSCRQYDVVGRVGGEEFAVLCPDTTSDAVTAIAERFRIATTKLRLEGLEQLHTSISAGCATRTPKHNCFGELLRDADEMLYRAKNAGRNQVWIADESGPRRIEPGAIDLATA